MKGFFTFLTGIAIGAVAAWKIAEKKFKKIADDEIESIRAMYKIKESEESNTNGTITPDREAYEDLVETYRKDKRHDDYVPKIISADEFGESRLSVTFTLYSDGVVTDERDERLDDDEVMESIGSEFKELLKTKDVVYVRNEKRFCDYEVIADPDSYQKTHDKNGVPY